MAIGRTPAVSYSHPRGIGRQPFYDEASVHSATSGAVRRPDMEIVLILAFAIGGAALVWAVFRQNRKNWY